MPAQPSISSRLLSGLIAAGVILLGFAQANVQAGSNRVLWRFQMDSPISGNEVNVGPDATVYASDNTKLYALNPDGTLKWTRDGLGGGTPIDFLTNGTIVVGIGVTVAALNPDGTTLWTFNFDGNGFQEQIEVGPNVGPDGNIYAVSSVDGEGHGLGAFSLTPDGELRWSDEGEPLLNPINAGTGGSVLFTQERLVFPFRYSADGPGLVFGYDFDGHQTLIVDFTCTGIPRTDPLNRLLIASACGIEALEQDGNESFWTVQFGPVNLAPAIGDDATVYSGNWLGDVAAINPDGSIAWTSDTATLAERMLAARRDVGRLVFAGGGFGVPNFVGGVDTDDGSLLWTVDMLTVDGHNELVWTQMAPTSPDGSVVYFATRFTSNGAPGALYAVRVTDPGPCPADLDGDGQVAVADLLLMLAAWGTAAGDVDGNGTTGIEDLLAMLSAWGVCGLL